MLLTELPRTLESQAIVAGASASTTLRCKCSDCAVPTVPTAAGATAITLVMPAAGTLAGIYYVSKDALVQHATNIVTYSAITKGQAGAGTTALLAATDANTTKTTTGTAIAAYTRRAMTLHGTAANLVIAAFDVVEFIVTGGGTLANTLTENCVLILLDALG
jgi:hypothetical protein